MLRQPNQKHYSRQTGHKERGEANKIRQLVEDLPYASRDLETLIIRKFSPISSEIVIGNVIFEAKSHVKP